MTTLYDTLLPARNGTGLVATAKALEQRVAAAMAAVTAAAAAAEANHCPAGGEHCWGRDESGSGSEEAEIKCSKCLEHPSYCSNSRAGAAPPRPL